MTRAARIRSRVFAVAAIVAIAVTAFVVRDHYRAAEAGVRAERDALARSRAT